MNYPVIGLYLLAALIPCAVNVGIELVRLHRHRPSNPEDYPTDEQVKDIYQGFKIQQTIITFWFALLGAQTVPAAIREQNLIAYAIAATYLVGIVLLADYVIHERWRITPAIAGTDEELAQFFYKIVIPTVPLATAVGAHLTILSLNAH